MPALLKLEDVNVKHGSVNACTNVSLEVHAGEIVGLIGPNGAGKTSLVDGITGFAAMSGTVWVHGKALPSRSRPHTLARHGLARTFQSLELFDDLTVRDNLLVVDTHRRARGAADVEIDRVLALLGLDGIKDSMVGDCSHGARQVVSFARALVSGSSVLVLDEPAAGLDAASRAMVATVVEDRAASGDAVLIIDHDLELVMRLCHRIYVLEGGEVIASGTPPELRANRRVLSAYLGS
jgi:ABC-type branched-subunit amino acid transport system ATPase component